MSNWEKIFELLGWIVLCIALTAAMVITANAQQITVCDFDVMADRVLGAPDGYTLIIQYYNPVSKAWYAEYQNAAGDIVIVKQTFGEALDAEWRR